ncbi:hypothetical protein ScoT_48940 [Streptomyces albidoflavus]|uniref:Uncharacterized protein n=1 Tax=Streptomyces albidoflavus TaxID=1886 RepID=A0AA37C1F9_9ACTN|nr:hypothetical protein ScoT_48940 [Streptomyces albidoflavus]
MTKDKGEPSNGDQDCRRLSGGGSRECVPAGAFGDITSDSRGAVRLAMPLFTTDSRRKGKSSFHEVWEFVQVGSAWPGVEAAGPATKGRRGGVRGCGAAHPRTPAFSRRVE